MSSGAEAYLVSVDRNTTPLFRQQCERWRNILLYVTAANSAGESQATNEVQATPTAVSGGGN